MRRIGLAPNGVLTLIDLGPEARVSASSTSSPSSDPGSDKRRTTRVVQAIPVVVRGMDALGQAFKESTMTVMVNCNGCKYRSKHYVPKDSRVTVEIIPPKEGTVSKIVPARVVWVQRPRTFREIFHVALEFEVPGNVWPVASPPKDWFPHPDDEHLEVPVSGEGAEIGPPAGAPPLVKPIYIPPALNPVLAASVPQTISPVVEIRDEVHASLDRGMALVMPPPPKVSDPEHTAAREMVAAAVEAVMAKEMPKMRERLEWRLQESVQETVKLLAQSITDTLMKDLVDRAAERTATIVVEARNACTANADQLDERIRQVVQEVTDEAQKGTRKAPVRKGRRKTRKGEPETVANR